jgi:hypothetical protein
MTSGSPLRTGTLNISTDSNTPQSLREALNLYGAPNCQDASRLETLLEQRKALVCIRHAVGARDCPRWSVVDVQANPVERFPFVIEPGDYVLNYDPDSRIGKCVS